MSNEFTSSGTLYVVATPIGNLEDITYRAIRILGEADLIAAEDTRHSRKLLQRYGITTSVVAYHAHNEAAQASRLVSRLRSGAGIALITDAGTPAISDPGVRLVVDAQRAGVPVVPVPGPSALTCALSVCGVGAGRFVFEGFLPTREGPRARRLNELAKERRAIVLFEAPHRIVRALEELADALGHSRMASVCREMTKMHETVFNDELGKLALHAASDADRRKGEIVIVIEGADEIDSGLDADAVLAALLEELSPRLAAKVAATILGKRSNVLYKRAVELRKAAVKTR